MLRPTVNGLLCVHNSHELCASPVSYVIGPDSRVRVSFRVRLRLRLRLRLGLGLGLGLGLRVT